MVDDVGIVTEIFKDVGAGAGDSRVVADDPGHVGRVDRVAREGPDFFSHQRGHRVGGAGHDAGEGRGDVPRFVGIVGVAGIHHQ